MRVCFHLKVRRDRLEEYKRLHAEVWPAMLAELKAAGVRNYSLFLWREGNEFGILECDDWQTTRRYLAASEVARRWEDFMREYLETDVLADSGPDLLEEVFHLE